MAHQSEDLVGLHQGLGVGQTVGGVEVIVVVDEAHGTTLKAAGVVVLLQSGIEAGIEGDAHVSIGTGGGGGVADEDLGVGDTLDGASGLAALLSLAALGGSGVGAALVVVAGGQGKDHGAAGQEREELLGQVLHVFLSFSLQFVGHM